MNDASFMIKCKKSPYIHVAQYKGGGEKLDLLLFRPLSMMTLFKT